MRKFISLAGWFGVYLLIAIVITYPLITQMDSRLIGHPFGDAYEYVGLDWWIKTALQTGRNPFFHSLMLYPEGISAPLLWSIPLQSFPTWLLAFVMPLPTAFNLTALLTLALNGTTMLVLVRYLLKPHPIILRSSPPLAMEKGARGEVSSGSAPAAFLSGVIWLAYPAFQGQLGAAHTGLLALWGAPLWVYALLRLRDAERPRRWLIAAAVLFPVSLSGNMTLIVYLIAPLAVFLPVWAWVDWMQRRKAARLNSPPRRVGKKDQPTVSDEGRFPFGRLLLALVLGVPLWLPFALPTLLDTSSAATLYAAGEVRYSAPLVAVVAPSFYHPLFSGLDYSRRALGVEPFELTSYVGLIAAVLCLIGLILRRESRLWGGLALAAWVFSLGALLKVFDQPVTAVFDGVVTPVSLPWALFQHLPGVGFARTPARFNIAVGFAVAVMAGYGMAALTGRQTATSPNPSRRRVRRAAVMLLSLLLTALILFEYQVWFPLPTVPGIVPDGIRALSESGEIRAVFDVPYAHPLVSKEAMFLQTGHGLPILTGQVTRQTPIDPAKAKLLETTLDLALLNAAGVDAIILHREWDDPNASLATRLNGCCGDPIYQDEQYAVYRVPPAAGEAPGFVAIVPGDDTRVEDEAAVYFYAPAPGGALLNAGLSAANRNVIVRLDDGAELARWTIDGAADAALWVEYGAGYHTLTLALDPPCAVSLSPALECRALTIERAAFGTGETP